MGVSFNAVVNDDAVGRPLVTQVKLSSKYQIVIPQDVREQLGLEPGQRFEVLAFGGHIVAVPLRSIADLFGSLPDVDTSDPRDHEDRL